MLYLVIGKPIAEPPEATVASLADGVATLEALVEWERTGRARFAGVFSGANGIAFVLDVESHTELHLAVASLPPFTSLDWQVTPLLSAEEDLTIARGALEHYRALESDH